MASTQPATSFRGWTIPGPRPPGGITPDAKESLDAISGHWRLFQLKKGHRFSTDDLVCAWYATQWAPRIDRYCDLGSGIGSVALMVAWRRPACSVVTLEAQEVSLQLQRKSIRYNGVDERFTSLHGDLRDPDALAGHGPFDLVTGSPPYWATDAAVPADKPQAFGARLEARGTVADYAHAAARTLAPGGVFACVFQAAHDERVRAGIADAGLALVRTRPVRFKAGVEASRSGARVYLAARRTDLPEAARERVVEEPPLTVRAADGTVDDEYAAVKMSIGFPP